jgi:hypothetical protein
VALVPQEVSNILNMTSNPIIAYIDFLNILSSTITVFNLALF